MKTLRKTIELAVPVLFFAILAMTLVFYAAGLLPEKAYALYSVQDDMLLMEENADVHTAPASLAKLLTACTALRFIDPEETFTVGSEQDLVPEHSSLCLILEGHSLKLKDLIAGMLMVSGNDAAYAVAVSTVRFLYAEPISNKECVEYFCGMMNSLAYNIGMTESHFVNPDGTDDENQYTTARDLIKLAKYAMTVPVIKEIVSEHERYTVFESGQNITWTNSNKLIDPDSPYYSEYALGMKTGTTSRAGNCLIGVFEKDGKTYISVVLGCWTDSGRYEETLRLINSIEIDDYKIEIST